MTVKLAISLPLALAMILMSSLAPVSAQGDDRWSGVGLRGLAEEPAFDDGLAEPPAADPGEAGAQETTLRQRPVPRWRVEEDPYAPLGIRAGSFLLFPALEMRAGYSDNVARRSVDPRAGAYLRLVPEIEIRSDWSRHELRARAAASHRRYDGGDDDETTSLDGEVSGRLDVLESTRVDLRLSYSREPESRDDPNVPPGASDLRDVERLRGEGSVTHQAGRLRLTLRAAEQSNDYSDDDATSGAERSYRTREGAVRAALDIGEGTAVFVETGVNRRRYDRPVDAAGVRRGSRGYEVLAGVELRLTGLLSGELGVGYQHQKPDDHALRDIDGVIVRGALNWEPSALTTLMLSGSLAPEESTVDATASGARVYRGDVTLAHAFRRNLIGTARLGYTRSDYVGSSRRETTYSAVLGLEYLISREVALLAEAGHERHRSNLPGGDYEETRVEVGVRLRR